jgi:hypothetical protein
MIAPELDNKKNVSNYKAIVATGESGMPTAR